MYNTIKIKHNHDNLQIESANRKCLFIFFVYVCMSVWSSVYIVHIRVYSDRTRQRQIDGASIV